MTDYSNVSPDTLLQFGIDPSKSKVKSPIASMVSVPAGTTRPTFRKVVAGAVMAYQMHRQTGKGKTLPTIDEICRISGVTKSAVSRVCATNEFRLAMKERGIDWSPRDGLTPEQTYCIGILTNPADKSDMERKLKKAGIDYQVYRNWLKQPIFAAAVRQIGEDMLKEHIADVHTTLTREAVGGNMRAIELYYQISGRFDPAREQTQDLNRLVTLLLEVLFRNITDVKVLERINEEFTMVLGGETPVASLPEGAIIDAEVEEDGTTAKKQELTFDLPEGIELNEREHGNSPSGASNSDSSGSAGGFAVEPPLINKDGELPPGFFEYFQE